MKPFPRVNSLPFIAGDVQRVQEVLDGVQNSGASHPGSFCFSLSVWVLRNDGNVAGASLLPDASLRVFPLSASASYWNPRVHYEGGLTLRCLRVTAG